MKATVGNLMKLRITGPMMLCILGAVAYGGLNAVGAADRQGRDAQRERELLRYASQPRQPSSMAMAEGAAPKANVGGKVAGFTLKNVDGADVPVTWDAGEAKATVLVFVSARCPVSNAYNERLQSLAKAYEGKGVQMFGLNANAPEKASEVKEHAAKHGWSFPVLLDAGNKIADQMGANVTPEAYVVNRAGVLVYAGRVDDSQDAAGVQSRDLAAALHAVLEGKAVTKSQTAAFGCGIKRAG